MAPSFAETEDRGALPIDYREGRAEASDDMHDTLEEMARWKPLAVALQSCQDVVEPAYRAADRPAMHFQRRRQAIAISAAIAGTIAVLLATFDALDFSRFIVPVLYFSVGAAIAFVAVLLGIATLLHVQWMFLRHKAERFRFLKFRFLIDPHLWGDDAAQRKRTVQWLTYATDKVTGLTHEELKTWAERGIIPEEPPSLAGGRADTYTLHSLVDY